MAGKKQRGAAPHVQENTTVATLNDVQHLLRDYAMTIAPSAKYNCWLVFSQRDPTMSKVWTRFEYLPLAIVECADRVEHPEQHEMPVTFDYLLAH